MNHIFKSIILQTNGTPGTEQALDPAWLDSLKTWSGYLATGVEIGAALIIGIAAIEAFVATLLVFFHRQSPPEAKENVRLRLGRWLAVALEFGLAADILRTAVAPSWNEIGQLVVIAFLRTALNFFLQQEIDRTAARETVLPTSKPSLAPEPGPNENLLNKGKDYPLESERLRPSETKSDNQKFPFK